LIENSLDSPSAIDCWLRPFFFFCLSVILSLSRGFLLRMLFFADLTRAASVFFFRRSCLPFAVRGRFPRTWISFFLLLFGEFFYLASFSFSQGLRPLRKTRAGVFSFFCAFSFFFLSVPYSCRFLRYRRGRPFTFPLLARAGSLPRGVF